MGAVVTYPELARADVQRSLRGVSHADPSLVGAYAPGVTEPWIQQIIAALLVASGAGRVLETGSFLGVTSAWLALTLSRMGGGTLLACEIDEPRADATRERLDKIAWLLDGVTVEIRNADVLDTIRGEADDSLGFAWIDDDHTKPHVRAEIAALWPKMRKGGLMVFHDVYGSVDLQEVVREYGGYSLDLPRLGPAGGLGVIQK